MRYCKKCVMPDTKPDLVFDESGVCSACVNHERKHAISWGDRFAEWEDLIEWAKEERRKRNNSYDCIIPVSGGKDSHFQTYKALQHGLRPLLVSFEPTMPTELGKRNLKNCQKLISGCDLIQVRKNPELYRRLSRLGFELVGDSEWPNHVGIFTTPVQIAVKFNIPLLIWGENSQEEYGSPNRESAEKAVLDKAWLYEFGGLLGLRPRDIMESLSLCEEDVALYLYPPQSELERVGVRGVFLGHYFFWDARKQADLMKLCGFEVHRGPVAGGLMDYENLDCSSTVWHDYMKFVKYGFGRVTDQVCLEIRNARMPRSEGVSAVNELDGKFPVNELGDFSSYLRMTKDEVFAIIEQFTNPKLFTGKDERGNLIRRYPVE